MRLLSALCLTSLIGAALAQNAAAQSALNIMDTSARTVRTQTLTQTLDAMGKVVDGQFGDAISTALSADGGRLNATIEGDDVQTPAATFDPVNLGAIRVMFGNGMFTENSDQVTTLDPQTGAARLSRTASGMITIMVNVGGLMIMQPVNFSVVEFAATDMGPLFVAESAPRMGAVMLDQPLNIGGRGLVCAMAGSPFLAMTELSVPDCNSMTGAAMMMTDAFLNEVQVDPKPFDAMTGEIRPVGVQVIKVAPFTIAGIMINVNPVVRFKLDSVQRITEGN
jgi:hypothetical protein